MKEDNPQPERVELRVRTKEFALHVIRMYSALPRCGESDVIGRQVLKSGTSVGANFREAHRARSDAEFISKVGDCLKEVDETAYWIELVAEAGLLPPAKVADLQNECNQLLAILTTISRKVKANQR